MALFNLRSCSLTLSLSVFLTTDLLRFVAVILALLGELLAGRSLDGLESTPPPSAPEAAHGSATTNTSTKYDRFIKDQADNSRFVPLPASQRFLWVAWCLRLETMRALAGQGLRDAFERPSLGVYP